MSNESIVGIVEEVINNGKGKGSGLRIGGHKYGVYDPDDAGLDTVSVGTTVSLRYKTAEKGGITYKNVTGKVTTVKDGTAVTAPVATAAGAASSGGSRGGFRKNGEEGGFPIHSLAYERALDRRNAIATATALAGAFPAKLKTVEDVFEVARRIEAYTTGDEITKAEDALSFMRDTIDE